MPRKATPMTSAALFLEPRAEPNPMSADDYRDVPGMVELVRECAERVRTATDYGIRLSSAGKAICETMLDMRLKVKSPKGPFPDLHGDSRAIKTAANDVYAKAAFSVKTDDAKAAHLKIKRAVQNQMSNVLVPFLRSLDDRPDLMRSHFPQALEMAEASDSLTHSEAVYKLYADHGIILSRQTRNEEQAAKRQLERKGPGDDAPAADRYAYELATIEKLEASYTSAAKAARDYDEEKRTALKTKMLTAAGMLAQEAAKL